MNIVNINADVFEDYAHNFGCLKCDENSVYDEAVNQCPVENRRAPSQNE